MVVTGLYITGTENNFDDCLLTRYTEIVLTTSDVTDD